MREYLDRISSCVWNQQVHLYRTESDGSLQVIKGVRHDFDYLKPDYVCYNQHRLYKIMAHTEVITQFCMVEFPGCCAFCISHSVYVFEKFRKRGVNRIANELRQWIAKEFGYTALVCTDVTTNVAERKTLAGNGFRDIYQVVNLRTNHPVAISVKEL